MKVSLIRLSFVSPLGSLNNEPVPPLPLALIAGPLKLNKFDVNVIDATGESLNKVVPIPNTKLQYNGISVDEVINKIPDDTKIIGISSNFSHEWLYVRDCICQIRNALPDSLIIVGGEHATALPEYSLKDCRAIDYIALGEGEETMLEFCQTIRAKQDPSTLQGLAYLVNGKYIENPRRSRIKNLDDLPLPAWELFPLETYLKNAISFGPGSGRNMPIIASRGCPYRCAFCSSHNMWGQRYYFRSPQKIIDEIVFYKEKYHITSLQFYDLTAIVQKEWVIEFCQLWLKNNINLSWSLPSGTRSEALDEETLGYLAKTKLRYLVYAPESGSEKTLKYIDKRIDLKKMTDSVKIAIKKRINVRTNFIIAFPRESRLEILRTLLTAVKFSIYGVEDSPLFPYQPYPGSVFFDYLVKSNRLQLNDKYFNELATFSSGCLGPPNGSYSEYIGRYELWFYRIAGLILTYAFSYLCCPRRILRTIKNLLFTQESSSILEQRLKDRIRKSRPSSVINSPNR